MLYSSRIVASDTVIRPKLMSMDVLEVDNERLRRLQSAWRRGENRCLSSETNQTYGGVLVGVVVVSLTEV